jgi:hypothetical protein
VQAAAGLREQRERCFRVRCDLEQALLREHRLPDRALTLGDLLASLRLERFVDDLEQRVVLPQADAEGDAEHDRADDQAAAQLVEVVDETEAILVTDRAKDFGHQLGRNVAPGLIRASCSSGHTRTRVTEEQCPRRDAGALAVGQRARGVLKPERLEVDS